MQENNDEQHRRKLMVGLRGVSRLFAVQTLYKLELEKRPISDFMKEISRMNEVFITEEISLSEIDMDFFYRLVSSVEKHLPEVDKIISEHLSKKWTMERLSVVMKCILRLALTELMCFCDIPKNVVFNEYIEISKAFFDKSEASFVNGLLNEASTKIQKSRDC